MRTTSRIGLILAGLSLCACVGRAAVITNVMPVNVTPSSFTIVWRAVSSTPSVAVFADSAGSSNLVGQLGIETFPLHTGSPDVAAGYERRQTQYAIRQKTQSLGLMMVRVSGCRPNTTYYYRLTSTPPGLPPLVYPESGPLPSVTTALENTFVVDAQQLIIDVPGLDNLGRIVTLSNRFSAFPLAAVVGDGVGTNQVFFNANDLVAPGGQGNFSPLGDQQFTATVLRAGNQSEVVAQFSLTFGTNFLIASAAQASYGTEFLAVNIGSAVLQTGQSTNVPLALNCNTPVSSLDLLLNIPAGHLSALSLQSLAPEVDAANATIAPQGTNWLLHLPALPNGVILGAKTIARLAFTAVPGRSSAFVPFQLLKISAPKPDSSLVTNLFGGSGRAVVIGQEALLEPVVNSNGVHRLALYGKPASSYALEYTTELNGNAPWWRLPALVPMMTLATTVDGLDLSDNSKVFYRAVEFFADPPMLQGTLAADGTRLLTVYGVPGHDYALQYADAITFPMAWKTFLNLSLGGSFAFVTATNSATAFYKVVDLSATGPRLTGQLSPDSKRSLLIAGEAGRGYTVEYTTNFSSAPVWYPLTTITLTSSLGTVNVGNTNPVIYYRLKP